MASKDLEELTMNSDSDSWGTVLDDTVLEQMERTIQQSPVNLKESRPEDIPDTSSAGSYSTGSTESWKTAQASTPDAIDFQPMERIIKESDDNALTSSDKGADGWEIPVANIQPDIDFEQVYTLERDIQQSLVTFNERRTEDVPCKFHDGFSGTCWKGAKCFHGHKKYTGGVFAKKHPDLAMAAELAESVSATPVTHLFRQSVLALNSEFMGTASGVVSPSEFYIVPEDDEQCLCQKFHLKQKKEFEKLKKKEQKDIFDCDDLLENLETPQPKTIDEKLHRYLTRGMTWTKHQSASYTTNVEMVAARIRGYWRRSVILYDLGRKEQSDYVIRVQSIDTGEKAALGLKDVCRLPSQFSKERPAAFECFLFGVSALYLDWTDDAKELFWNLIKDKRLRVVVKDISAESREIFIAVHTVQLFYENKINENNFEWVEVAPKLAEVGEGIPWNLNPYRPSSYKVMETSGLAFMYQPVPMKLPEEHLELERKRRDAVLKTSWPNPEEPRTVEYPILASINEKHKKGRACLRDKVRKSPANQPEESEEEVYPFGVKSTTNNVEA